MKKILIFAALVCLLTGSAAALVPDDVTTDTREDCRVVVKTYTLEADEDPALLIEEPFDKDGYSFSFDTITQTENRFEHKKQHSETVTSETDTDDLETILARLPPHIPYGDGEFSGRLTLDHTSLKTEAAGYSTEYYTVTDTKTIGNLDRNDPGYVPKTTVKNGLTLTLSNVEWTAFPAEGGLVPAQYTATATYTGSASAKVADGYITSAVYSGEVVSSGIESVTYTVRYYGTKPAVQTPEPSEEPVAEPVQDKPSDFPYIVIAGVLLVFVCTAVIICLLTEKNVRVYSADDGDEYELLGKQRITAEKPGIDLLSLKRYPTAEAVIEIKKRIAHKLFGRMVKIRLRDEIKTHLIEQSSGDNYWFTVSTKNEEESQ